MLGLSRRAKLLLAAAFAVIGLLILANWAAEYLWFDALGFTSAFWLMRTLKVLLFLAAFALTFAYFWINFRVFTARTDVNTIITALAAQQAARQPGVLAPGRIQLFAGGNPQAWTHALPLLAAAVLAVFFGLVYYARWDTALRYWWSRPYGEADPVFGHDIGFYLFELPLLGQLQSSLSTASLIVVIVLLTGYRYAGRLPPEWRRFLEGPPDVIRHIAANLALYLVVLAWSFYLDRYDLLQSTRGVVHGAGYTERYVELPALWIMMVVTLAMVPILPIAQMRNSGRLLVGALGGYLVSLLLILVLAPGIVQAYLVEPNELELETPFLRHNIALTRKAYQLDKVEERSYEALQDLTPEALARNRQTVDNIRVWDWKPLSVTFRQLQQIRTYYAFGDVDVDRYRVDGATRQVMLAARELSDTLPVKARTWLNRHLQYTHGYGLAMSLAAEKGTEGDPVLLVRDLPPRSEAGLSVAEPAIYYGENMSGYRIVATGVREFSYPKGDENVYTRYDGTGGVAIDAFWKRLLFAWHQFDANIAITSYIDDRSRIQFWRNVQERVGRAAPFLRLDADPYIVLSGGRLYWIQDAYTESSEFPYSEPHGPGYNYIRNSVKAVVDAYDGDVAFYVMDTDDPVLAVYRSALPELFRDLDAMPAELRRHLRYPQDLFEAQVAKYSTYHMTVPQVFYNSEDPWAAPREKYGGEVIDMEPYYVLVRLPGEADLQFLLMTPLTPAKRPNMIAWMAARSDIPGYGELLVYKLPKERLIHGPIQVEATIDQDTLISQQLSLWDQRGSRVIRGNLLVIPIDHSFIYVEPVYLIAEDSAIPQLKRVIVSDGQRIAMEPTLRDALNVVFGVRRGGPEPEPASAEADSLAEARKALTAAEQALRDGDWSLFGRSMQRLRQLLGD
ncbi:MAG: UPF0182 family protein [Hyphomicrobiales bacterium]|nr:UPF0182 family protein [Hyphomicrobiales bacterium]